MRGKASNKSANARHSWDHPRLCGEKCCGTVQRSRGAGSPPPMRGKVAHFTRTRKHVRITPAYAGKRSLNPDNVILVQDHPRLCGEKVWIRSSIPRSTGSPPPMRGKVPDVPEKWCAAGITPAYAGKRQRMRIAMQTEKDHPRLCGEKQWESIVGNCDSGSPPPMRGKDFH